jgi:hypothetical protein
MQEGSPLTPIWPVLLEFSELADHARSLTTPESPLSWGIVQQPKGGDPVSHCLSPQSPASMSWILASTEVRAA